MAELRMDPIQRRWVIISSERAHRPSEFQVNVIQAPAEFCPFCPGNEAKTPLEILAIRDGYGAPNSPGWSVRVVPNKYPALRVEGELDRRASGIYDLMNGIGAHEILIETPEHGRQFADLTATQLSRVLGAYRDRIKDLVHDRRFSHLVIFRNYGDAAGATLAHPHSQIMAMPILPQVIETELRSGLEHLRHKDRCLFCDIIRFEAEQGVRVVEDTGNFISLAPYASRSPFELWIAPKYHQAEFQESSDAQLAELARIMRSTMRRLRHALNDPPYNLVVHMSPNLGAYSMRTTDAENIRAGYHWHIEIIPRLTKAAGFEWGTGFYINPTPPEDAVEYLKRERVVES